jgi:hypothetical protein
VEVESFKEKSSFLIIFFLFILTTVFSSVGKGNIELRSESDQINYFDLNVEVSSRGTFLRADFNPKEEESIVQEPTVVDLEIEKIIDSKWISIRYSGDFFYSRQKRFSDGEIVLIGLFSTTSELKSIEYLHRVPGAIDAGIDYKTGKTLFSNLSTDIPEDFIINYFFETVVEIPNDAKFLFLCIADLYYPDNSGSIQVSINQLEYYQVIFSLENVLIMLELAFIFFVVIYYQRNFRGD